MMMSCRKIAEMKFSEYRKQASLTDSTTKQLAQHQSPNGVNIGHPWIHTGFNCSGCAASPITGFLYKCQRRKDYYLCESCYRKQPSDEIQDFLRFERAASAPPYQIYCVQCDECGVTPIQGPRYRQKSSVSRAHPASNPACQTALFLNLSLEALEQQFMRGVFRDAPGFEIELPHPESPSSYELLEETTIKSARKIRSTVFHYGIKCNGCKVSPICGPRYCLKFDQEGVVEGGSPTEINLCLICFDSQYNSGNYKEHDDHRATGRKFRRILRGEGRSAVHVEMLSCRHCNATPICGPAYLHLSKNNEALCLFCYMNLSHDKQESYARLEPPSQLNPTAGNITEEEFKNYLDRRKPACGREEEELLEATMAAQRRYKFKHNRLLCNPVKHNVRISQEIENWTRKIENEDGSWSWAYP